MSMPRAGTIAMLPAAILLLLGFAAPVGFVVWTSLMPPRTFERNAGGAAVLPHIRFDRALDFLLGDRLS